MNPKILIPAALITAALVIGFLILGFLDTGKPGAASAGEDGDIASESVEVEYADISGSLPAGGGSVAVQQAMIGAVDSVSIAGGGGEVEAAREQIFETIHDASVTYDVEGLKVLGPLLGHADPEVRAATIEGIIQLGETAGAKTLREAARKAKEPREAAEMIRAAKFLELPEYQPPDKR